MHRRLFQLLFVLCFSLITSYVSGLEINDEDFKLPPSGLTGIDWTQQEIDWFSSQSKIRIGMSFQSYRTTTDGLFSLIMKRDHELLLGFIESVFSHLAANVDFDFITIDKPSDMEDLFTNGNIDIMIGSFIQNPVPPDRLYGQSIIKNPIAVISRDDDDEHKSLTELQNESVGVLGGGASSFFLEKDFPAIRQVHFMDYRRALDALKEGNIEAFVGDLKAVSDVMDKYSRYDFVVSQVTGYNVEYSVAVRSDWPEMIEILNKIITQISSDDRNVILKIIGRMIVDDWASWIPLILIGFVSGIVLILLLLFTLALNKKLKKEVKKKEKVERNLIKVNEELDHSNKAKSQFLANMSHEIRTPMNAILGLTHLALKTELTSRQKEYLEKISTSADNLLVIINDILDFSKIDAGKLTLDSVPFKLKDVLDSLESLFGQAADEKNLFFEIISEPDVPEILRGDPLRLGQILINLAGNAVKFTENGGVRINIALMERDKSSCILAFTIKDTGIGLTEDQSQGLFTPFSQADGATTRKYGGTGLGLAISRELTEMMAGEIGVDSVYGEGSSFHFSAGFGIAGEDDILSGAVLLIEDEGIVFPEARVLLVEDNKINQEVAFELLQDAGIKVDLADNGRIAVEMLRETPNKWDLVLMDILMPEMDGYTATQEIRNSLYLKGLPIIAMTASAMAGDKEKSIEVGMNDYIQKPIDSHVLFRTLKKYLNSSKAVAEQNDELIVREDHIEEFVFPDFLPGIDMEQGLLRMGGKKDLYGRMLIKFYRDEKDWILRFNTALKITDNELALRMAHTLKSTSGNLGCETLSREAARLETVIREHPLLCRVVTTTKVGQELNRVFAGIAANIKTVKKRKTIYKRNDQEVQSILNGLLRDLIPNLEMRKQRPSKKIIEEITMLGLSGEYSRMAVELEGAVKKYDYKEALGLVRDILNVLREENNREDA